MATFVRIRRLHRMPLRVGSVNVTNGQAGSVVNIDDPKVKLDLRNNSTRYVFLDRYDASRVAQNATSVEANMSPFDATSGLTSANLFGGATGGKEFAAVMNLPAGFPVTNVSLIVTTAAGGATTHMWATVATYDGSTNFTYQAASPDVTSGTVGLGKLTFNPVVSAGVVYVTPTEGQYIFTFSQTAGTSGIAVAGFTAPSAGFATATLAGPIPQNLSNYGNPVTNALINPFAGGAGTPAVTTPPAVASTNAASNFTASAFVPYIQVS